MKRITFSPKRCMLCGACSAACSLVKTGRIAADQSRIRIETAGSCAPLRAAVCQHCEEPACVTACMRGIIEKDAATGLVTRRYEDCFRCAACSVNCPAGACIQDEKLGAFIACDLCGGEPLCVQVCLPGALRFEEEPESSVCLRTRYAQKMFAEEEPETAELTEKQWQEICRRIDAAAKTKTDSARLKAYQEELRTAAREEGVL